MASRDELLDAIAAKLPRTVAGSEIERVFDALIEVAVDTLRARGQFEVPGLVRLLVVKTPAMKERRAINPFTRQEMVFPAKPAGRKVRAKPDGRLTRALNAPDD